MGGLLGTVRLLVLSETYRIREFQPCIRKAGKLQQDLFLQKIFTELNSAMVSPFGRSHALKCELASEVLHSSGRLKLKVTGSSMLPSVFPGDTVIVERTDVSGTREGDIVLVSRDGRLFAHRLLEKRTEAHASIVLTKGDSMRQADPAVEDDRVLGKVSFIL